MMHKLFFKNKNQQEQEDAVALKKVIIVGSPNVGKSALFNNLANSYNAHVSNYPGTTVEVYRGELKYKDESFEIIDTPGMYSLLPISDEEKVARDIILTEEAACLLHVIDAKNIRRMLPMTLNLIEMGLPVILILNMIDEAEKKDISINTFMLKEKLGIPVIATAATSGQGLEEVKESIHYYTKSIGSEISINYQQNIEEIIAQTSSLLHADYLISKRSLALFLLQEQEEIHTFITEEDKNQIDTIRKIYKQYHADNSTSSIISIAMTRKNIADNIFKTVTTKSISFRGIKEKISNLMTRPLTGIPILLAVLYFGLYKFVGGLGAGEIVDFLEGTIFEKHINPAFTSFFSSVIPWATIQDLFVGEYGIFTLGLRYAVALILPIVTLFFFIFSIIEDSGYLPRLALLIDRIFKKIGLSGRAVIPMVLGFGCATMATMVTRTLDTKRERIIATMLLALAIPCSAQLGVIMGLLQQNSAAFFIWALSIMFVFLFIGFLTARILPGTKPIFFMEMPPLRVPSLKNIIAKTYVRVKWYFKEILPIFLLASVAIWIGKITGLFNGIISLLQKPVTFIGLPAETAKVFLLGFFRRDYGAAGLYDLNKQGALSTIDLVVASVALTLFLPCIAQFLITIKERGWKTGIMISLFILLFAFSIAFALNKILHLIGGLA